MFRDVHQDCQGVEGLQKIEALLCGEFINISRLPDFVLKLQGMGSVTIEMVSFCNTKTW